MTIPTPTDRLDDRLDALFLSLQDAFPALTCTRSLKGFAAWSDAQLETGVLTLVSAGERDYSEGLGMVALDGTQDARLVAFLKVAETTDAAAIEARELDIMEDIKGWVRAGFAHFDLQVDSLTQSAQLEHPYGWVVARLTIGPPRSGVF